MGSMGVQRFFKQKTKSLIRLCGWADLFESLLYALANLYFMLDTSSKMGSISQSTATDSTVVHRPHSQPSSSEHSKLESGEGLTISQLGKISSFHCTVLH